MKLDIMNRLGEKIGEITNEQDKSSGCFVVLGIIAFVFVVVLPIIIWYIFLFQPNFHKGPNEQENFNAICTTAAIAPCVWGLLSKLLFRLRIPIVEFFLTWFICSGVTICEAVFGLHVKGFMDTVLLPVLACALPCLLTTVLYAFIFRSKKEQ